MVRNLVRICCCVWMAAACLPLALDSDAAPPGSGWRLNFADEFSGDVVDSLKWQAKYPWGRQHNHNAYMQDKNVVLGDGTASLIATREPTNGKAFSSGAISTGYNKYIFTGGYAEARILLPNTNGSWPAFWGLYTGWPPEADIMEYPIGAYNHDEYHTAYHYSTGGGGSASGAGKVNPSSAGNLGGSYHKFGMEWKEDDYVAFYFDDQLVSGFGTDSAIAQMEHMYLILNYAVGGWPGTPGQNTWPDGWADQTKIDWVRVWKKPSQSGSTTYTYDGSATGSWDGGANWSDFEPKHSRQQARFETLPNQSNMEVTWSKLKTVGEVYFDGDTTYTIGDADSDSESLMFADDGDGWSRIWVQGGVGGHSVESRIEAWSHLSVKNAGTNPLVINGDIIGHARGTSNGGRLLVRDSGQTIFNGDGYYQRQTEVRGGANFVVGGGIYQGVVDPGADLYVHSGATVSLSNLNDAKGSLGNLPGFSNRILLDDGVLEVRDPRNTTVTRRGLTIGENGATLRVTNGAYLVLHDSVDKQLISEQGGSLTLDGVGTGVLHKRISGTGGIYKQGAGQWIISSQNTYSGPTNVLMGSLIVNGSTGTGNSYVAPGATLGGHSHVPGTLENAGTLAPGQVGGNLYHHSETAGKIAFDFSGVQDTAPLTATSRIDTELNLVQRLDFGPGTNPRHPGGGPSDNGNEFNASGWSSGLRIENAIDEEDYLSFVVAPTAGLEMQLDTASFELWRNGSGAPRNFAVLSSLDGFSGGSQLAELHVPDPDDGNANDGTDMIGFEHRRRLDAEYTGSQWIGNNVEVRLYGWGANGANGNMHLTAAELTASFRTIGGATILGPVGQMRVGGNLEHVAGANIELEIGGVDNSDPASQQYDSLLVDGHLTVAGDLRVSFIDGFAANMGDRFDLFGFQTLSGDFDSVALPPLASNLAWDTSDLLSTGELLVIAAPTLAGDYNDDGVVNLGDYSVWRDNLGADSSVLINNLAPGVVGVEHYMQWKNNFGASSMANTQITSPVPETTAVAHLIPLLLIALLRIGCTLLPRTCARKASALGVGVAPHCRRHDRITFQCD